MSFTNLSDALKNVNIDAISEIELVKLIREVCNNNLPADNYNRVTLHNAMIIAKALKASYNKGYWDATNFIAGG